jgi:hypothetical protein
MQTFRVNRACTIGAALLATLCITACDKAVNSQTAGVPTDQTAQSTTPPPPGDSTPKAADSQTRAASEANEKPGATGAGGSQTTVGTAASGAPPYTLQGAPEGNPSPKGGEAPKK